MVWVACLLVWAQSGLGVVSQVSKALAEVPQRIDSSDMIDDQARPTVEKSLKAKLKDASAKYREIVRLVSQTTGRAGSDQILGYCLEVATHFE